MHGRGSGMSTEHFNEQATPPADPSGAQQEVPATAPALLPPLKVSTPEDIAGYKMLDETTVVFFQPFSIGRRNELYRVSIFDFNELTKTSFIGSASVGEVPENAKETPFPMIPGAGAIVDAHRALTEQGGKPMALNVALGIPADIVPAQPSPAPVSADEKPRNVIKGFGPDEEKSVDKVGEPPQQRKKIGYQYKGRD